MAGLLAMGAGAGQGLEKYLALLMQEQDGQQRQQQLDESGRHNLATEAQSARALDYNDSLRRDTLAEAKSRSDSAAQDRGNTLALKAAEIQPIGSRVGTLDMVKQTNAGVPRANFGDWDPGNLGMDTAAGKSVAPTQEGAPWRGTAAQIGDQRKLDIEEQKAAKEKAPASGADDARYEDIQTRKTMKQPVAPEEDAWSKAYEKRKTLVGTNTFNLNAPTRDAAATRAGDAQLERSYNHESGNLNTIRKPIADQADRINRIMTTMNANSPQADALIAPELLTAMAGGQGSGLRMNEAEISRIIGGRNAWEGLKATLGKYSGDPNKPFAFPPEQRTQIQALVKAMHDKLQSKQDVLNQGSQALIDAGDVKTHRQTVSDIQRKLADIDNGVAAAPDPTTLKPGDSYMGGKFLGWEK